MPVGLVAYPSHIGAPSINNMYQFRCRRHFYLIVIIVFQLLVYVYVLHAQQILFK